MWPRLGRGGARPALRRSRSLRNLSDMTGADPALMSPRVLAALEAIYVAFAAPTPRVIEGCPCCIGTRRVDVLLTKPLRELTGADLWRYVSGAFLTIGSDRDFRYLLPRILELGVGDPGAVPDTEIILGQFALADRSGWSKAQYAAVTELVGAWFDIALERDLREAEDWLISSEAEGVLCGAARGGFDVTPFLSRLAEPSAEPVRACLADRHAKPLAKGAAPRGFWEDAPATWGELAAILASEQQGG